MANSPFYPALPSPEGGEFLARFRARFGRDPTADELRSGTLASMLHQSLNAPLQTQQPTLADMLASPSTGPTREASAISEEETNPYARMSARTRALGLLLGGAQGAMTPVTAPYQAGHAIGATMMEGGEVPIRTTATPDVTATAPPTMGALPPSTLGLPAPTAPPARSVFTPRPVETELGTVGSMLNPADLVGRIEAGDPEAIGSVPGMVLGGKLFDAAGGVDAANVRRAADDLADQRARDAEVRQASGPVPTAQETALATPTYARRSPPVPRPAFTPPTGDLETPTFARRAVEGTPNASAPGMTPVPPELLARADELATVAPREPTPLETAGSTAVVHPDLLDAADQAAQELVVGRPGERIASTRPAAIRLADGAVYRGGIHLDAFDAAKAAGVPLNALGDAEIGFVTDNGRFIDRDEAEGIADRSGQAPGRLRPGAGLAAEDLESGAVDPRLLATGGAAAVGGLAGIASGNGTDDRVRQGVLGAISAALLMGGSLATAGEERGAIDPGTGRNSKFVKMDDAALEHRYYDIADRVSETNQKVDVRPWVRKDAGYDARQGSKDPGVMNLTGNTVDNATGRAIGRMKDDGRILGELQAEFKARGIPIDDVHERYFQTLTARGLAEQELAKQTETAKNADADEMLDLLYGGKADRTLVKAQETSAPVSTATTEAPAASAVPESDNVPDIVRASGGAPPAKPPAPPPPAPPGEPPEPPEGPKSEAEKYLNLRRMNLPPEAQAALEPKVVQAAADVGRTGQPVRTFAEASAAAKALETDLPRLLKIPADRLTGEERLALRNVVTTDATRAVDLARAIHDPNTPPGDLADIKAELSQINQRQQQILPKLVTSGTQQGRDLAYNRILAQQTTDPAFWLERATRIRGDEYPLSDAERAQVAGLAQAGNRQALADYVAKLAVPTWQEKLVGLGKTNLISSLTTATKIGATNLLELGRAAVTGPLLEQPLDWLASGISGVRTRMGLGRNLLDVAQRAASGVKADVGQLARGETPAVGPQGGNLLMGNRELEYVAPNAGAVGKTLGGAANAYTHGVGRLHSILHRVTWQPAYQAALFEQGRILGAAEGLKGQALDTRARALADQPTGEMFQRAVDAANRATFLDKSGVSTWLQQFARSGLAEGGVGGNLKYFGTNMVVPFARISTNIVKAGAEYSPLGMAMAVTHDFPAWLKAVKAGDPAGITAAQRAMIDRVGRAAPGTAAFMYGYMAYKNGTMTSTEPESAKERDLWKNRGMGPNAIKVGDGWRNVLVAGPLGLSTAMGAAFAQATAKAQTTGDKVSGAMVGGVRAIAEESFLRGIEDLGNALHDPAGAGTAFLRNTITSWSTPNVAASVAKATDPSQLGRVAKTLPQSLQARVPGEREGLPPGLDAFGRPMLVKPTVGSVAKGVLDPSNPRANPSAGDPVLAEMTRVGVRPTYAKQGPQESQGQYLQRVSQQGAAYRRLADDVISGRFTENNMPSYAQAPQIAQALVQQSPEFRGKDPATVTDELRAMALEHAFAGLRAAFTKGQPKAATTDRQLLNRMRSAR